MADISVIVLVMILLFPLRSAMVAALTVPLTTFIATGIMYAVGIELNIISLASLIVVLGMIVDNAIVVIDGYLEYRKKGYLPREAAIESVRQYFWPMLLATLCIWICAPWLVQLALGQGYEQASGVLRIVACLAPILGCNFVLGSQILVPFGREKALTAVQCAVALASAPLAVVLCLGGDVSLAALYSILVEGVLLLGLVWHVRRVCPAVFFVHGEGR